MSPIAIDDTSSRRRFLAVAALLFAASAALTITQCLSMSRMGGMPMPGGWTMSMMWMRMPGQSWAGAAVAFLGMWSVMMIAMMLPSLLPLLWRYREAIGGRDDPRRDWLTATVGLGYFLVWTLCGLVAFVLGVALAALAMERPALAQALPLATGVVAVVVGALQWTPWKAHHLACCRAVPRHGRALPADSVTAWCHGLRLGLHCSLCCAGLTALLLVVGVMDLRAMALVTAAITAERVAPAGQQVARGIGAMLVAGGMFLLWRLS